MAYENGEAVFPYQVTQFSKKKPKPCNLSVINSIYSSIEVNMKALKVIEDNIYLPTGMKIVITNACIGVGIVYTTIV